MNKEKILFICTGNSARSQMAEGFVNNLFHNKYTAYSAGTDPSKVNSLAIQVMSELGIDISHHKSKSLNEMLDKEFDFIITVCDKANQTCPVFPNKANQIHIAFDDPSSIQGSDEQRLLVFRRVRDEIKEWISEFLAELQK